MRKILLFALLLQTLFGSAQAQSDYPKLQLANDLLQASIFLPDAERGFYRGTRFDWSGIIEQVKYQGHTFYRPFHPEQNPKLHDAVSGPAAEFAMYEPMGFAEAKPGEGFIKIGVGILRKADESDYQFNGQYELIQPGQWHIEHGDNWVQFSQTVSDDKGWGYAYQKRIELPPGKPEILLSQRLQNTGTRAIKVDHYNHNFTLIDDTPYGPDYQVSFPFSAPEPTVIFGRAYYEGHQITVPQPLAGGDLWHLVHDKPGPARFNKATIRNLKTGAGVTFQGDTPISHFIFWAVERAACPEPFINIELEPGEAQSWNTRYHFFTDVSDLSSPTID